MSETTPTERIIEIAVQHAAGRPLADQVQILTDCVSSSTDLQAATIIKTYCAKLKAANKLLATFRHAEYRDQI